MIRVGFLVIVLQLYYNGVVNSAVTQPSKEDFNITELEQELPAPIYRPKPMISIEDAHMNISELLQKYGYKFEEHSVITEDGYVIKLHRVGSAGGGRPVLLMHGILDSSDTWVLLGPHKALAYELADQGYDVWMGNARGNKYSNSHIVFKRDDPQFWKFTWEEIGVYDLPAMIDYILNFKKVSSVYYVGHSQGTTCFYVMCSVRPEYNAKVTTMFSLAPVAFMGNVKSPIVRMFAPAFQMASYFRNFNAYNSSMEFRRAGSFLCMLFPCNTGMYLIIGGENNFIDDYMLPIIYGHIPSSSSLLQIAHYGQLVENQRFCRYDYGVLGNRERYGQDTPPDYDLSKITVPIVLFCSGNDWLSQPADVKLLRDKLKTVIWYYYIDSFNHLDYLYSSKATNTVYKAIVDLIA